MARRLQIVTLVAAAMAPALPVQAVVYYACWVEPGIESTSLEQTHITRCRLKGGATVDFASDSLIPSRLHPNLGSDLTGQCWYYTSRRTDYTILRALGDGSAQIGLTVPSGLVVIGPTLPRCTSEPASSGNRSTAAWDYVMSYIHRPPVPELDPRPGLGVTGLETYVGTSVPARHRRTISGGGIAVQVDIWVSSIVVDWGDGTESTYPADSDILAGYPNGSAVHFYETKGPMSVTVAYDWTARWRVSGSAWEWLSVPNTSRSIDYPVSEVVSRLNP